jgi:predicted nucleic acid-binding protein
MKTFADPNWLAAVYLKQKDHSAICQRRMEQHDFPLYVSRPVLLECAAVFPWLDRKYQSGALATLTEDLGIKVILTSDRWEQLAARSQQLLARYANKANIGTWDSLIVASALLSGCDWFYSFDTGSNGRALAAACNLKVFPELSAEDKRQIAQLR